MFLEETDKNIYKQTDKTLQNAFSKSGSSVARLQCPPLSCRNSSTFPAFAQSPTRAVLYQTKYTDLVEDMLHKLGGRC